ncbi:MAG: hypothetical protein ACM3JD_09855, partial [Rudaea sp.]
MAASISIRNRTVGAAFLCAALVLFLQGTFYLVANAQTPTSTRLEGQVRNGTAGTPATTVAGMPVTLFQMGASGPVTRTVQTDPQGNFSFGDVALASGGPYFISADYAGIHYFSDVLQGGGPTAAISLTVYETETIPANFVIDRT